MTPLLFTQPPAGLHLDKAHQELLAEALRPASAPTLHPAPRASTGAAVREAALTLPGPQAEPAGC